MNSFLSADHLILESVHLVYRWYWDAIETKCRERCTYHVCSCGGGGSLVVKEAGSKNIRYGVGWSQCLGSNWVLQDWRLGWEPDIPQSNTISSTRSSYMHQVWIWVQPISELLLSHGGTSVVSKPFERDWGRTPLTLHFVHQAAVWWSPICPAYRASGLGSEVPFTIWMVVLLWFSKLKLYCDGQCLAVSWMAFTLLFLKRDFPLSSLGWWLWMW